jgi:hypothetical protein
MRGATFGWRSVPGAQGASREADLVGGLSSHYLLCESTTRLLFTNVPALRIALADAAHRGCDGLEYPHADCANLTLRPVLVAALKNCFAPDFAYRARVAFDLDGDENSTMPDDLNLVRLVFVEWLNEAFPTAGEFNDAQCVIFGGSFADKPASLHVYFPQFCWEPADHNRFANNTTLVDRLSQHFTQYGLKIDKSIHTGGLKYPYMDKWIKSGAAPCYRGKAQQCLLMHNVDFASWLDFFNLCDPLVISSDEAYENTLNFASPPQRQRVQPSAAAPASPPTYVQPIGEIDAIIKRVYEAVTQWSGCTITRKQARLGEGVQVLVPQHTYCPLKKAHHSTTGATYVILANDNTLIVKCHKSECAEQPSLHLCDDSLQSVERTILQRFNSEFCILDGNNVARLPTRLDDGTYSELKVMSHQHFIAETSRNHEKIGKVPFPRLWLQDQFARRCPLGLICSPTPCDPRYYNTWCGIRRDVLQYSEQHKLYELTDEQLRAKVPNWLRLVDNNICQNNADVQKYVFDWFAHCFQRPADKPGVALVLSGIAGIGKGLTANMIVNIYGAPHGISINASLLGSNYNSLFSQAAVLFVDEMEKVKHARFDNSKWKSLVTETKGVHSEKYVKESQVRMFQHIILGTNAQNMLKMQNNERRYFVLEGAPLCGDLHSAEYLQFCVLVAAEIVNVGAMAALYTLLMRRDISTFVPGIYPITLAHWRARYLSLCKPLRYVYRVLATGNAYTAEIAVKDDTKAQFESLCSEWLEQAVHDNARTEGVSAAEIGMDIFTRANFRYPCEMFDLGYKQQFSKPNDDCNTLWRDGFYQLATSEQWQKQRTRVLDNTQRIYTMLLLPQDELRRRFVEHIGNVDARIWTPEWKME